MTDREMIAYIRGCLNILSVLESTEANRQLSDMINKHFLETENT